MLRAKLMATEAAASDGAAERKPPPQPKNHAQKSLLRSEALYQYILETCGHPREPEALKELRHITAKHPWNIMAASADEVQFLSMLLKLVNAKETLEIGVFTGYSLLASALALPDDGEIVAIDIDGASYENIGLPVIRKAGVAHKIDFRQGCALPILDQMIQEGKYKGWFDFVFVDADKRNYIEYHKRAMELVMVGGVVAYDNTLWGGTVVAPPEEPISAYMLQGKEMIMEMNKHLTADPRIDICLLSISDGLTLCRRLS